MTVLKEDCCPGRGHDPVKVLWFTKGLGRGGTEQILMSSIRHLNRERFDLEVAYLLPWKDALVADVEATGVTVHCLDGAGSRNVSWPLRLRSLVRRRGYSIVHTHMPYPASVARVALGRSGPALVHTEHNVWDRFRPMTREANALTLSMNKAVIAVSGAVADSITRPRLGPWMTPPIVEVIYHGIEADRVRRGADSRRSARAQLGFAPEDFVLGTVGNLTPKKDHRTMFEAVARLAPRYEHLRLVVIGDGPLRRELESTAESLGVSDRVRFTGSRPDVPDLLPGLDAFVLSSRFEGFPIALVEAMATGLACVATTVGGTPELVTDGENGLLVRAGAPALLAQAISKLLEDPELRSSLGDHAARETLKYGMDRAVERLQCLYAEVLTTR